jgi:hypothetical protein
LRLFILIGGFAAGAASDVMEEVPEVPEVLEEEEIKVEDLLSTDINDTPLLRISLSSSVSSSVSSSESGIANTSAVVEGANRGLDG